MKHLIPLALIASLLVPAVADAHTMSLTRAKNQTRAKASVVYVTTGADYFRLTGCNRQSRHAFICGVRYAADGGTLCTQRIGVSYRSNTSYLVRTRMVKSNC